MVSKYITRLLMGVVIFQLAACGGGGSSSAPAANVGNIPNLAAKPTPQSGTAEAKKIKLAGKVINSINNEPIEQATIWVHVAVAPPPSSPPTTPPTSAPASPPSAVAPTPLTPSVSPPGSTILPSPGTSPMPSLGVSPSPSPSVSGPIKPPGALTGSLPIQWRHETRVGRVGEEKSTTKSYRTTTNNQGKFWLNDIPEGDYNLTIMAQGYTTLTIIKAESNKLNIPLTPSDTNDFSSPVTGMVLSTADTPVEGVTVNSSFVQGDVVGIPDTTNEIGEFTLPAVPFGKHTLVAFVMDNEQVIRQMGLEHGVHVTDKSIKAKESALKTKNAPIKPFAKGSPSPKSNPSKKPTSKMDKLQQDVLDILKPSVTPQPTETESPSPSPQASASASASPKTKTSPSPSAVSSNKPNMPTASAQPTASPSPSASLNPVRPITPPSASPAPSVSATASPQEENEETPTKKEEAIDETGEEGFNLFKAIGGIFTGKEPDTVKAGSVYPVITLRTILSDFILEGTVQVPASHTLTGVDVYLALKAEQKKWPDEIFLFNQSLRPKTTKASPAPEGSASPVAPPSPAETAPGKHPFRLRLPDLENGQSYHLQFNILGPDKRTMLYKHLYDLKESKNNIEVDPLAAIKKIDIEGEDSNTIPLTPLFSWEAVTGAEIYQVQLEAGTDEHTHVVWEAWTRDTSIEYPLSTIPGKLKEKELYRVSVSALKGLRGLQKAGSEPYAYPTYRAIWTDLAQTYHKPFEVVKAVQ